MGKLIALPQSELYQFPRSRYEASEALPLTVGTEHPGPEDYLLAQECPATQHPDLAEQNHHALAPASPGESTWPEDRDALRRHMVAHSIKGAKMPKTRSPYIGEIEEVTSPVDAEVTFGLKHIGTREMVSYRDRNSVVRYITRNGDNGDEYISEKEFPAGTGQVDTIYLCLARWNLTNDQGIPLTITHDTIQDYLSPEELDFLFAECHRINPILLGIETRKND